MPHTHTEPGQYDPTVTMMIVAHRGGKKKVLLPLHRKYGVRLPPGGHIELHESPWQAVARELHEETGYDIDQFDVLQFADAPTYAFNTLHPMPLLYQSHGVPGAVKHFHTDVCFALVLNGEDLEPRHAIAPDESPLEWFTAEEVEAFPDGAIVGDMRAMAISLLTEGKRYSRFPAADYFLGEPPVYR